MRSPRRLLTIALASVLLGGGMALATVTPAQAHDQLLSSYPEAGSTINGSPAEITLSFSGELLSGMQSAVVEVIDPDGQNIAVDDLSEGGTSISQHLTPDPPAGEFTVRWKVVSSDGHPISGEYMYTVEANTSAISTPAPTTTVATTPAPSPTDAEAAPTNDNEYGSGTSGGGSSFAILAAVGGAIVVGGALIVVLMLGSERRRRDRADAERARLTDAEGKDPADGS